MPYASIGHHFDDFPLGSIVRWSVIIILFVLVRVIQIGKTCGCSFSFWVFGPFGTSTTTRVLFGTTTSPCNCNSSSFGAPFRTRRCVSPGSSRWTSFSSSHGTTGPPFLARMDLGVVVIIVTIGTHSFIITIVTITSSSSSLWTGSSSFPSWAFSLTTFLLPRYFLIIFFLFGFHFTHMFVDFGL